ncbi:MAG: hypothetical protein ACJ8CB_23460, partial [Ktedonobacteraceae bacterium]
FIRQQLWITPIQIEHNMQHIKFLPGTAPYGLSVLVQSIEDETGQEERFKRNLVVCLTVM